MTNTLSNLLTESKSVCILLPKNPYLDQVAAGLSLFLALKSKNASILCESEMIVEFNRLVGVNKISQTTGGRNLEIRLKGYDAKNVERLTYDVDGDELFLTIFPVPGITPPGAENIAISHAGLMADSVILIGGANASHFSHLAQKEFSQVKLYHIGISDINLEGREVTSLARVAASISEIVASEITEMGLMNPDIATNLFQGLLDGSKNFTSQNVSAETFRVASELLTQGARREKPYQPKVEKQVFNANPVQEGQKEPQVFKSSQTN